MLLQYILYVLPWVLPVIIGASIGYITNAIAIRMLFRPLTEKRIMGIRLPFTPGIIPRQRYELSENIAKMVSKELITEEAVKRQLEKENFKSGIKRAVQSVSNQLLESQIDELENRISFFKRLLTDWNSISFDVNGLIKLLEMEVYALSGSGGTETVRRRVKILKNE